MGVEIAPALNVGTLRALVDSATGLLRRGIAAIGQDRAVFIGTLLAVLVTATLALVGGPGGHLFNNLHELIATRGSALALDLARRRQSGSIRRLMVSLAASLVLATIGMLSWDLANDGRRALTLAGDVLFVGSVAVAILAVVPAIFGRIERNLIAGIAVDALILFLAGVVLVASTADPDLTDARTALLGLVLIVAATAACAFALVTRRIRPGRGGPWTLLAGASVVGVSWLIWLGDPGAPSAVGLSDFLFSAGCLLVGLGGLTWTTQSSQSARFERLAPRLAAALPIVAILASLAVAAIYYRHIVADLVGVATAAVIVTAVARQQHLYVREARALSAEHQARLHLATEISERASTLFSLRRLTPAATLEETARQICREALQLDEIDLAAIRVYSPDGGVVPIAVEGLGPGAAKLVGRPLMPAHAARVRARAVDGLWERTWGKIDDPYQQVLRDLGLHRTTNAALRWQDAIIGDIGLGTCSVESAATLGDRLSTVEEFAVVASALLGPAIMERDRTEALRRTIGEVVKARSFHPVFQPIVDLASREVVGYEALTRFDSGQRPDLCFADAWSVGLGARLELATIEAAIEAARHLPSGVFLDLNASPRLLADSERLAAILGSTDRPIVLEITEHEVVDDYDALRDSIRKLEGDIRVAVDDAGAGVANFGHIIDLRPDFVKLDISLVRRIDANLGRQALVVGMRHFSRKTRCRLIAEGVETPEEAATLTALGVEFGQGYLFGRPDSIGTPRLRRELIANP